MSPLDQRHEGRSFDAVGRVERHCVAVQQRGESGDRCGAARRALIDLRLTAGDRFGVGATALIAAARALGLRQQRVDVVGACHARLNSPACRAWRRCRARADRDRRIVARGEHHALGDPELHLSRREVRHHDGQTAHECRRIVGGLDPREHGARPGADIESELQQFVGSRRRAQRRRCVPRAGRDA